MACKWDQGGFSSFWFDALLPNFHLNSVNDVVALVRFGPAQRGLNVLGFQARGSDYIML